MNIYTAQELEKMVRTLIEGPKDIEQINKEGSQLEVNYHAAIERHSINGVVDMTGFIELSKYMAEIKKQNEKRETKQKTMDDYEQRLLKYFEMMPEVKLSYRLQVDHGGRQRAEDYIISLSDDKKKLIIRPN